MQYNAIILGGAPLHTGVVDVLHKLGYFVIVVDYRENITLQSDLHILFDAKDPNIAQELRKRKIDSIDLVYTSMDEAGLAQRAICKEYGLYYADEQAMINAHDKSLMHACWKKNKLLNRESTVLTTYNEEFFLSFNQQYKTIIKPSDCCASRGITILEKNFSQEMLKKAFEHAQEFSNSSKVNVEEFIEGIEYSVEMLGDDFGNVSVYGIGQKYHSQYAVNNKVACKVLYNSQEFSPEFLQVLSNTAINCYKALGLKNSLGHLEIIQKNDGTFSPIEMGARSSSFIVSHLIDICNNKCFLQDFADVLHGKSIPNGLLPQAKMSSMFYFYDLPAGKTAQRTANISQFLPAQIRSVYWDRSNLVKGKHYFPLTQDTDRYGYEILIGPQNMLTIEAVCKSEQKFYKELFDERNGS